MDGETAQRDVVRLGAGEIEQRGAIALLRYRTHVDLQAGAEHDGRARRAVRKNLGDVLVVHELIADRRAILRSHHNVQIADRVAAPAIAAGNDDAAAIAEKAHQRFCFGFGDRQLEALLGHGLFERGGKLLFDNRPEPPKLVQSPRFDDPLEGRRACSP